MVIEIVSFRFAELCARQKRNCQKRGEIENACEWLKMETEDPTVKDLSPRVIDVVVPLGEAAGQADATVLQRFFGL